MHFLRKNVSYRYLTPLKNVDRKFRELLKHSKFQLKYVSTGAAGKFQLTRRTLGWSNSEPHFFWLQRSLRNLNLAKSRPGRPFRILKLRFYADIRVVKSHSHTAKGWKGGRDYFRTFYLHAFRVHRSTWRLKSQRGKLPRQPANLWLSFANPQLNSAQYICIYIYIERGYVVYIYIYVYPTISSDSSFWCCQSATVQSWQLLK